MTQIAVLGAGAFGTAIAATLARAGNRVALTCRTPEQAEAIAATRQNIRVFPGHHLPDLIEAGSDADAALGADMLFLAFPAHAMRDYAHRIAAVSRPGTVIVNLVKGLDDDHFTFARLFAAVAPAVQYATLKGPTFARPVLLGEWSGLTCGADDAGTADAVIAPFGHAPIVFDRAASAHSVDIVSALKNVYAIAQGLVAATGPSENTVFLTATLVMREMRRVLDALACDTDVILRFAGVGDTMMTGLCDTSRNRTLGMMIGKGIPLDLSRSDFLAEGARAVATLHQHLKGCDTPLLTAVADIVAGRAEPTRVVEVFGLR